MSCDKRREVQLGRKLENPNRMVSDMKRVTNSSYHLVQRFRMVAEVTSIRKSVSRDILNPSHIKVALGLKKQLCNVV